MITGKGCLENAEGRTWISCIASGESQAAGSRSVPSTSAQGHRLSSESARQDSLPPDGSSGDTIASDTVLRHAVLAAALGPFRRIRHVDSNVVAGSQVVFNDRLVSFIRRVRYYGPAMPMADSGVERQPEDRTAGGLARIFLNPDSTVEYVAPLPTEATPYASLAAPATSAAEA